jgi:hypothetical protein
MACRGSPNCSQQIPKLNVRLKKDGGAWSDMITQRTFLDNLGKKLNFKHSEDWYNVTQRSIRKHGGRALLKRYGDSPYKLLQSIYSENEWIPWKFHKIPANYWESLENRRKFVDWLGHHLGFKHLDDWYKITMEQMFLYGGRGLLEEYNGSPWRVLKSIYPHHPWIAWKFHQVPKGFWKDSQNLLNLCDWLGKQLHVRYSSYKISEKSGNFQIGIAYLSYIFEK